MISKKEFFNLIGCAGYKYPLACKRDGMPDWNCNCCKECLDDLCNQVDDLAKESEDMRKESEQYDFDIDVQNVIYINDK